MNELELMTLKAELNGRIDVIDEKIKAINSNLEHLSDDLAIIIDGLNHRIDDTNNSINRWFAFTATIVAISAPLLIFVIERFLK